MSARAFRAVAITAPGRVELVERSIGRVLPDEVLVRVRACGICTLEKRIYLGKMNLGYPLVGGHEVSGVVEEVGEAVPPGLEPGMGVALDLLNRCGQCHWCRRGASNRCENRFKGRRGVLGGMSQYVAVPAREVFALPDSVPPRIATLAEPLADCLHSLGRAGLDHTGPVAVVGLGVMGLLHVALLRHLGHSVLGIDTMEAKRDAALEMGAQSVAAPDEARRAVDAMNAGHGAPSVVVTAPGASALRTGLDLLSQGGVLVVYSSNEGGEPLALDPNRLHYDEATITGTQGRTELDFARAVDLLAAGALPLDGMVSRVYHMADAAEAFAASLDPDLYRVVISFEEQA